MKLYSENDSYKLYKGDMRNMLDVIKKESIDAVLTDPPYELNFMGKGWDNSGIAFQKETWEKCYEVLKPGGYLLAFGGSRTFHRIACAIEDAGFEIRDTIMWLYGSGFPKSFNIGKQMEAKVLFNDASGRSQKKLNGEKVNASMWTHHWSYENGKENNDYSILSNEKVIDVEYTTELGKKWKGWGTQLKPSYEPIIIARKPVEKSIIDNVIEYGVGGINIDECRVGNEELHNSYAGNKNSGFTNADERDAKGKGMFSGIKKGETIVNGRFPANTILTYDESDFEEVCGGFPNTKSNKFNGKLHDIRKGSLIGSSKTLDIDYEGGYTDSGSASRYFMNCKYTGKDEEIWKQLLVNNVGNNLEILKATKDNIVQINVEDLLKELKDHYAKYADNQLELIETNIVQDIVKILNWDFKIETSQVIQDFILNYKECSQFLNLVQFVEKMDNIGTTLTTQNLLKLFGYVKVVITNYIVGNVELDQRRYTYQPKASKKDRDEGLDEFEEKKKVFNGKSNTSSEDMKDVEKRFTTIAKNTHPTVKPTELMQYLVRLVSPNNATILDPFNGSGSTGKAVMYENREHNKNYKYIGIELTEEYLPISKARIEYVCNLEPEKDMQMTIFDFIGDDIK